MSNKVYELICTHCHQEYTAKSTKSRFCGGKCRTAAHRIQEIKAMPAASKGDKLALLMDESEKISHKLNMLINELKVNRMARIWDRVAELQKQDRIIIREIADLVTN